MKVFDFKTFGKDVFFSGNFLYFCNRKCAARWILRHFISSGSLSRCVLHGLIARNPWATLAAPMFWSSWIFFDGHGLNHWLSSMRLCRKWTNKTAGYNRHFFSPQNFTNVLFRLLKAFFSDNCSLFRKFSYSTKTK